MDSKLGKSGGKVLQVFIQPVGKYIAGSYKKDNLIDSGEYVINP